MTASPSPVIMWFRDDLRLADNRALCAAVATRSPVIACYVLDEAAAGEFGLGGASRWWLHHSLAALARELEERGVPLVLRRGSTSEILPALAAETGATAVHASATALPTGKRLEAALARALESIGVELETHPGVCLFPPDTVRSLSDQPFKVFTPFWKACLRQPEPGVPLAAPRRLRPFAAAMASDRIEDWKLRPASPDWAQGFAALWTPGEAGAHRRLESFVEEGLDHYRGQRDRPAVDGTSRLSAHLRFGELSPRQVWQAVRSSMALRPASEQGANSFLRELGWREFSYHLLHHWPRLTSAAFRPAFDAFPWRDDPARLSCWQRGATGYPLVDAGMRQLWQTGWMHNRVRMVVASFLVKHLLISWRRGAEWFWDTLVDADLANNSASWQWVAGSGADAAPYFRIFNPVLQGQRFDPEGDYVRRWVPELAALPAAHIHAPWRAPSSVLDGAGITLGNDYPEPVVDHDAARARALAAYAEIKGRR